MTKLHEMRLAFFSDAMRRFPDMTVDGRLLLEDGPWRVAVEALREPTEEMIEAAWADALGEDAPAVWKAMISAILNEKPE